jgi:hypothetical protein
MSWNVNKLKEDVRVLYGDELACLLEPTVRSFQWRLDLRTTTTTPPSGKWRAVSENATLKKWWR